MSELNKAKTAKAKKTKKDETTGLIEFYKCRINSLETELSK